VRVVLLASLLTCVACGPQSPAPTSATAKETGADGSARTKDGGAAPEERPFAGSTAEATSFISTVVDNKHTEIATCVREFRVRKKMAHDRVAVSFGIDQEGKLLGVTSKGKEDVELQGCIQNALKSALFPRSHSGVITVTKTYEELVL
jgi:hypothetical protein